MSLFVSFSHQIRLPRIIQKKLIGKEYFSRQWWGTLEKILDFSSKKFQTPWQKTFTFSNLFVLEKLKPEQMPTVSFQLTFFDDFETIRKWQNYSSFISSDFTRTITDVESTLYQLVFLIIRGSLIWWEKETKSDIRKMLFIRNFRRENVRDLSSATKRPPRMIQLTVSSHLEFLLSSQMNSSVSHKCAVSFSCNIFSNLHCSSTKFQERQLILLLLSVHGRKSIWQRYVTWAVKK